MQRAARWTPTAAFQQTGCRSASTAGAYSGWKLPPVTHNPRRTTQRLRPPGVLQREERWRERKEATLATVWPSAAERKRHAPCNRLCATVKRQARNPLRLQSTCHRSFTRMKARDLAHAGMNIRVPSPHFGQSTCSPALNVAPPKTVPQGEPACQTRLARARRATVQSHLESRTPLPHDQPQRDQKGGTQDGQRHHNCHASSV